MDGQGKRPDDFISQPDAIARKGFLQIAGTFVAGAGAALAGAAIQSAVREKAPSTPVGVDALHEQIAVQGRKMAQQQYRIAQLEIENARLQQALRRERMIPNIKPPERGKMDV